jgi:indole-3-glycerol phosphate synthase
MNILQRICSEKRIEVTQQKKDTPLEYLQHFYDLAEHQTVSFKEALMRSPTGIIAEFKRKSPTKGWISPRATSMKIVPAYVAAGASAISILTDRAFFGGRFFDFKRVRKVVDQVPFLRKDFIIDEYQVHQSKVLGADVILLIASCLTGEEVAQFAALAHELDMEVLLEIHNENELSYITGDVDVVGVNNRDLTRFVTDIRVSLRLADRIPAGMVRISESGISDVSELKMLQKAGYQGFLIGESFMKTADPGRALADFLKEL